MSELKTTKEYSWESLVDLEEDVMYMIEDLLEEAEEPGEFQGTIVVTVEYRR